MLQAGSTVILKNLQSRADLNGQAGIVLLPSTTEEQTKLQQQGRVKIITHTMITPISVKIDNLTVKEVRKIDWSLLDGPQKAFSDLLQVTRLTHIGELDRCDEYVELMLKHINHDNHTIPLRLYDAKNVSLRTMLLENILNHSIYVFQFDQIGHHFIVEVQHGKARVFQSYIKNTPHPLIGTIGYTAKEWVSAKAVKTWSSELKALHAEYGGGRELPFFKFVEILDNIRDIQKYAKAITDKMHELLPASIVTANDEWNRHLFEGKSGVADLSQLGNWCNKFFYNPWMISISWLSDFVHIFSNESYDGEPFVINIPNQLANPFRQSMKKLNGMDPTPVNYIMLFFFMDWEIRGSIDEKTDEVIPIGWTFSAISIPH